LLETELLGELLPNIKLTQHEKGKGLLKCGLCQDPVTHPDICVTLNIFYKYIQICYKYIFDLQTTPFILWEFQAFVHVCNV